MAEHAFTLTGQWDGGRGGLGEIRVGALQSQVSAPAELNGPGQGTNPEEMLTGAAATCYMITLAAMLERRRIAVVVFALTTECVVSDEGGLHFVSIVHRPRLALPASATAEELETARQAAERAEKGCMVSRALRGNVEVSVEPVVERA